MSDTFLIAAEPQLFVTDLNRALDFFSEKLGFETAFVYGEPPFYAQVTRDAARINLRHVDGPVFDSSFRAREVDTLSATFVLEDAEPLYLEFQNAGVDFHQPLTSQPWGARLFIVADPDGNLLSFSGKAR